jgi:phosphoenolpyruvate synthase/pyruvate phosphate dikinase
MKIQEEKNLKEYEILKEELRAIAESVSSDIDHGMDYDDFLIFSEKLNTGLKNFKICAEANGLSKTEDYIELVTFCGDMYRYAEPCR